MVKDLYAPFYESAIQHEEIITFIERDNGEIYAELFFTPKKVISITNYCKEETLDLSNFIFDDKKVFVKDLSKIFYFSKDLISGIGAEKIGATFHQAKNEIDNIIFTETANIVIRQYRISYSHKKNTLGLDKIIAQPNDVKNNFIQLKNIDNLNFFLYGDSISTGSNSSKKLNIAPYNETWGNALYKRLEQKLNVKINFINGSVGGYHSNQGVEFIEKHLSDFKPDLAIIGFGMNCGTYEISPLKYKENMLLIIDKIRSDNKNCKIILIATILPNPISPQNKIQNLYLSALNEIKSNDNNCAIVNMTDYSKILYSYKNSINFLANNINHPNDFLTRCYVSSIMEVFNA